MNISKKTVNAVFALYVITCLPAYFATENQKHILLYLVSFIGYSIIPLILFAIINIKKNTGNVLKISSIIISVFWVVLTIFGTLGRLGYLK